MGAASSHGMTPSSVTTASTSTCGVWRVRPASTIWKTARDRHLGWFAREARRHQGGREALRWATRASDNILAAARHGLAPGSACDAWAAGMEALLALEGQVRVSGVFAGMREIFDSALETVPAGSPPLLVARAFVTRARLRHEYGEPGAEEDAARAESLIAAHGHDDAWSLLGRRCAMLRARFERSSHGVDGTAAAWQRLLPTLVGDHEAECDAWFELGCLEHERLHHELAHELLGRALEAARAHGLLALEIEINVRMGENLAEHDQPESARQLVASAIGLIDTLDDPRLQGGLLALRALTAHLAGDLAAARVDYHLGLALCDPSRSAPNLELLLAIGLALVTHEVEGPAGARRAFELVLRLAVRAAPAQHAAARWIADVALAPVDDPRRPAMMTMIDAVLDKGARHWRRYARLGLKLLRRHQGPRVTPAQRLRLEPAGPGWQSFSVEPDGPRVSLARRAVLRRVLDHLVRMRREAPGRPTTLDEIAAAGWPNEQIHPDAMASRVYVALSTLRRLGLGPWLANNGDGWLLALDVTA